MPQENAMMFRGPQDDHDDDEDEVQSERDGQTTPMTDDDAKLQKEQSNFSKMP